LLRLSPAGSSSGCASAKCRFKPHSTRSSGHRSMCCILQLASVRAASSGIPSQSSFQSTAATHLALPSHPPPADLRHSSASPPPASRRTHRHHRRPNRSAQAARRWRRGSRGSRPPPLLGSSGRLLSSSRPRSLASLCRGGGAREEACGGRGSSIGGEVGLSPAGSGGQWESMCGGDPVAAGGALPPVGLCE
jgi:hypothetical protein